MKSHCTLSSKEWRLVEGGSLKKKALVALCQQISCSLEALPKGQSQLLNSHWTPFALAFASSQRCWSPILLCGDHRWFTAQAMGMGMVAWSPTCFKALGRAQGCSARRLTLHSTQELPTRLPTPAANCVCSVGGHRTQASLTGAKGGTWSVADCHGPCRGSSSPAIF